MSNYISITNTRSEKSNEIVKYGLYFKFEQEYRKIVNAYHTAFAEIQSDPELSDKWPEIYTRYADKMSIALANWRQYGYKEEIERMLKGAGAHICQPVILSSVKPVPALFSMS